MSNDVIYGTINVGKRAIVIEENESVNLWTEFIIECESPAHFMGRWDNALQQYNIIINKGYCEIKHD